MPRPGMGQLPTTGAGWGQEGASLSSPQPLSFEPQQATWSPFSAGAIPADSSILPAPQLFTGRRKLSPGDQVSLSNPGPPNLPPQHVLGPQTSSRRVRAPDPELRPARSWEARLEPALVLLFLPQGPRNLGVPATRPGHSRVPPIPKETAAQSARRSAPRGARPGPSAHPGRGAPGPTEYRVPRDAAPPGSAPKARPY